MERFFSSQRASRRGIIPLLLIFLLIPQASGIGVGASPDRIDFGMLNLKDGAVRELYVINTGDAAERVMLAVDGVDLTVDPMEFDLASKENRAVTVSVDHAEAGEHEGSILITAHPSGDGAGGFGLGAASGCRSGNWLRGAGWRKSEWKMVKKGNYSSTQKPLSETSLYRNYPGQGAYCNQTGNLTAECAEGK